MERQAKEAKSAVAEEAKPYWTDGTVESPCGSIARARTELSLRDRAGWWKVRWGIARSRFMVPPGLYAVGNPTAQSHVFVSANYKMSFDHLRSSLAGIDGWILVIDTLGINVWCAAGKGTFATRAIAEQVEATNLSKIVEHRRLILPQLGAAGVSSQKVAKETGFRVTYGPVRARDIKAFLQNNLEATEKMRTVEFPLWERFILTPVELVVSFKYIFIIAALGLLSAGLGRGGYSPDRILQAAPAILLTILSGWLAGSVVGPTLLPFLPGRSFSLKGAVAGLLVMTALILAGIAAPLPGWQIIMVVMASFLTMNFTGCSTYTSPSGVRMEMRAAVPIQAALLVVGTGIWIASRFMERA